MGKDNIVFVWGANDKNQLGMATSDSTNCSDSSSTTPHTNSHDINVPH